MKLVDFPHFEVAKGGLLRIFRRKLGRLRPKRLGKLANPRRTSETQLETNIHELYCIESESGSVTGKFGEPKNTDS